MHSCSACRSCAACSFTSRGTPVPRSPYPRAWSISACTSTSSRSAGLLRTASFSAGCTAPLSLVSACIQTAHLQDEALLFETLAALTALTALSLHDCVLTDKCINACSITGLNCFRGPVDDFVLERRTGNVAAVIGAALTRMPRLRKLGHGVHAPGGH